MNLEAKITPEGINAIVTSGWAIKRIMDRIAWGNGIPDRKNWVPDDSSLNNVVDTPTSDDCLYDTDAPSGEKDPNSIILSMEYHANFIQWITWNGTRCSDYAFWDVEYKFTRSSVNSTNYLVIYNKIEVGAGTVGITLPTEPTNP